MRSVLVLSSRRQFLTAATIATTGALLPASLRATAWQADDGTAAPLSTRLDTGWEVRRGPTIGVWEAWRPEEKDLWKPTHLPHCVNAYDACDPDKPYFQGETWYRTHLKLESPFVEGRTLLHFQGAGQTTSAWVDGKLVGKHKGGYDEFAFDITEPMQSANDRSAVPVVICCDNAPDPERVPSDLSDFCLYGGLYRHLNLVHLPALSLDAVHIVPEVEADGRANVSVKARLYNPGNQTTPCTLTLQIFNPEGKVEHTASKILPSWDGFVDLTSFRMERPNLWSPETPTLYRCRVSVKSSAGETVLEERFGVRHTEFVEHGPFKLNGKRVLLRGTHRHADSAYFAAAMPDDLLREEMKLIRSMGANFIRLAHYQQDRLVLELCDELGLMVWEEVPWCRAGVGDAAFQQNAKDMLTHMIEQHHNHPSVILWGLGNEDDWPGEYPSLDPAAIRGFMTELRDLAHTLDDSRLTSFRRCDFARDIPDVYSPSIWAGWYRGNYREYEQSLLKESARVKRFIHMEWGADSQAGRHSEDPDAVLNEVKPGHGTDERGFDYLKAGGAVRVSSDGDWSESYACDLFDWYLKTQETLDWFTGSAQWLFKDFASPLRGDNDIPHINQKGVVERDMKKKESFFVFQSYWTEEPMVHIYGHTWPVRWGKPGEERAVKVYSNCERAELFLNGKSMGERQRDSQNFPAAGLRWNVAFAPGPNSLRVVATKGSSTVTDAIDLQYQTEAWSKPAELRLFEVSRSEGLITVGATLHDANGVLCLDARNTVYFSLAGDGTLIDNLGTAGGSRELQLYNGHARISLQSRGRCTVGIRSDGLPTTLLNLT
ncbi:MAG: glycoside hydrolase family 2 TIM barrel-domain containing protein [Acidobacteriaceae bacterium]